MVSDKIDEKTIEEVKKRIDEKKVRKLVEELVKNPDRIKLDGEEGKELEKLKKSKIMRLFLRNPRRFVKHFMNAFRGSKMSNEEIASIYAFVLVFTDKSVMETSKCIAYILAHDECKKKFLRAWKEGDMNTVRECLAEAARKRNLKKLKKNLGID